MPKLEANVSLVVVGCASTTAVENTVGVSELGASNSSLDAGSVSARLADMVDMALSGDGRSIVVGDSWRECTTDSDCRTIGTPVLNAAMKTLSTWKALRKFNRNPKSSALPIRGRSAIVSLLLPPLNALQELVEKFSEIGRIEALGGLRRTLR